MSTESNELDQPNDCDVGDQPLVHTPGPWKVCDEDRPGIDADRDTLSVVIYGNDKDDPEIGIQGRTREERKANARLIAAAPELLAACRYLMECIIEGTTQVFEEPPEHGQSTTTACERIEAAIRKAT